MFDSKKYTSSIAAIGNTPMIELDSISPRNGASILVKWEGANPTGSLKDRMALAMVQEAKKEGSLKSEEPIVEFTGGSTGSSLAMVCAVLDHPLTIVTADCVAKEKIASMSALGADLHVIETPDGSSYEGLFQDMRNRALDLKEDLGAYFTDQFHNEHQLKGYDKFGKEVIEQVPNPKAFTMTVGTGGCAMGTSIAFKERGTDTEVILVEPTESPVISTGKSGPHPVEGTALISNPPLLKSSLYDGVETVNSEDGVDCMRALAKHEGLLVGASSGMNISAAKRVAEDFGPDDTVVTVACDTGLKYLSDKFYQ